MSSVPVSAFARQPETLASPIDLGPPPSPIDPAGIPDPSDMAYWLGWSLGYQHEAADPPAEMSPFCRDAFAAGLDAGRTEAETEALIDLDRAEAIAASRHDVAPEFAEAIEARGHRAFDQEGGAE